MPTVTNVQDPRTVVDQWHFGNCDHELPTQLDCFGKLGEAEGNISTKSALHMADLHEVEMRGSQTLF